MTKILIEGVAVDDSDDSDDDSPANKNEICANPLQTFGDEVHSTTSKVKSPTLIEVMLDPDFI